MNKPIVGQPVQHVEPTARSIPSSAGSSAPPLPPKHNKPTGPVIYRLEKGADVWPGRK
jgi:hypothetical protein